MRRHRNRERAAMYNFMLVALASVLAIVVVTSVAFAVFLLPPTVRDGRATVGPPVTHTTQTAPPVPNTTVHTTTAPPTTTTTPVPTTTPLPYDPVNITCPPGVTVELGASLDPSNTGGSATGGGGCISPTPLIRYTDTAVDGSLRRSATGADPVTHAAPPPPPLFRHVESGGVEATAAWLGQRVPQTRPNVVNKPFRRSPSFPISLAEQTWSESFAYTGADTSDSTSAAGTDYVLHAYNTLMGARVEVLDKLTGNAAASFLMHSLSSATVCANVSSVSGTPQVLYDYEAQRWLLAERSNDALCLYISNSSDPLGAYQSFAYFLNGQAVPLHPQVAVWGSGVYSITFNLPASNDNTNPANMCVLDRQAILTFVPPPPPALTNTTTVNLPTLFCGSPLNGPLPQYATTFNVWTPVHAEGTAPPLVTVVANAPALGPRGALFMRAIDDEYQYGITSSTVDLLEIEHWFGINFTTATYFAWRYQVAVADFDSNPGSCPSSTQCIPTPTAYFLDPWRQPIMQRLTYRYLPHTGQQSVVAVLTGNANGTALARVHWMELRWLAPAPLNAPQWLLHQQGLSSDGAGIGMVADTHHWMPAASMDGAGTLLLCFTVSSDTVYPSVYVRIRLGNDPLGQLREPTLAHAGDVGSMLSGSQWGAYSTVAADVQPRTFFVSTQSASVVGQWESHVDRWRVRSEIVLRNWVAFDYCNQTAQCIQTIITQ